LDPRSSTITAYDWAGGAAGTRDCAAVPWAGELAICGMLGQ
jgi:hypothetical protein